MKLTVEEILKAVSGSLKGIPKINNIEEIVTDSRKANEKSLFVALKGENFDGHSFVNNVFENGCRLVLVHQDVSVPDGFGAIFTADTKKALGDIASFYIEKKNIKKIAITGSVGKTTTKDMVACVCANIDETLKTQGNFNNDIGVPLTAFRLEDEKIGIFEMGMNNFGEIEYLSGIVKPDISVITNIGYSHLENLGSREGILKAKLEVLNGMSENGVIVLNGDNELLYGVKDSIKIKTIFVGINNPDCDIKAENICEENGGVRFDLDGEEYNLSVPGIHNVYNALSAIAVGRLLGGDLKSLKKGLLDYKPDGIRQNIIKHNGYTIIADCYNASPDSMVASLDVLKKLEAERRFAVLGSVAELGEARDSLLYEVGKKIKDFGIYELITVSEDALSINKGANESGFMSTRNFSSNKEALDYIKKNIKEGDAVLIKGSRKYKMEEISEGLAYSRGF